ncbi:flavodoxin family protein [Lactiplantibacillus mudanjiangensis]|uniref:Flavodoxin [Lactobacillus pentosus] n=1 Tax=Lactiplantibacillus mudanjiangensis TaxID=1296538 RepID=A0A660E4V9_9LACO|nr:flavodoxin [Lactiplantibacillus mudanjiangensis]VDG20449.1 flavodoxin [Lactobacillus pentosus] [Lactiplantibacillus mudanjiangensis]VDG25403.1 flavodoxin [Lactobacillus pentosus] [Lactiplantibacillus mudanjiangensis]VDG30418.1 flavodoxin [Lactobacillus pentosus] [Lactiplantibacillus mudanjiangensis]VDG30800.1 flavodoxin [Lactobacillus pentosus] [Lactiplantibacillus mudanjiangensis]
MANQKVAVIYYSWSGTTERAAQAIGQQLDVDLIKLTVAPTTFSTDMYATSAIAQQQLNANQLPALTTELPDLNQYDLILVGGPVWGGTVSTPVRSFLTQLSDFKGIVAPFYTDAGTPGQYEADFKQLLPTVMTVRPGVSLTQPTSNTMKPWLKAVCQ